MIHIHGKIEKSAKLSKQLMFVRPRDSFENQYQHVTQRSEDSKKMHLSNK